MSKDDTRLLIDIADLRAFNEDLCDKVLNEPANYLPSFDSAFVTVRVHTYVGQGDVYVGEGVCAVHVCVEGAVCDALVCGASVLSGRASDTRR